MPLIAGFILFPMVSFIFFTDTIKNAIKNHRIKMPDLVVDPTEIQKDQAKTKQLWHEHKSGQWLPVKNFKIDFDE